MNECKTPARCGIEKSESPVNKNVGDITLNDIHELVSSIFSHEFTHKALFILVCATVLTNAVVYTGTRYTPASDVYVYCAVYSAWITICLPWLVQNMDGKALSLIAGVIVRLFAADAGVLVWSAFRGQRHLLQRGLRLRPLFEPSMAWLEDAGYNLRYGVLIATVVASTVPLLIDLSKKLRQRKKVDKEVGTTDSQRQNHRAHHLPSGDHTCMGVAETTAQLPPQKSRNRNLGSSADKSTRETTAIKDTRSPHLSAQVDLSNEQERFIEGENPVLDGFGLERCCHTSRVGAACDDEDGNGLRQFPDVKKYTQQAGKVTFSPGAHVARKKGKNDKHTRGPLQEHKPNCPSFSSNSNNLSSFTGRGLAKATNDVTRNGEFKKASSNNCALDKGQSKDNDEDENDKDEDQGPRPSRSRSKGKGHFGAKRVCSAADTERNRNNIMDESFSDNSVSFGAEGIWKVSGQERGYCRDRRRQRSRGAESLKNSVRDLMALKKLMMD